jgi:L-fucose mutarotase
MLRTGLIHPQILEALGSAGHGSLVLISDANFPSLTAPHSGARRVHLNLRPGLVSVTEILETLLPAVPIEQVVLMDPDHGGQPAVQGDVLGILSPETRVEHLSRLDFYRATRSPDLALVIVSGDQRWYANLLVTIGSIPEPELPSPSQRQHSEWPAADRRAGMAPTP